MLSTRVKARDDFTNGVIEEFFSKVASLADPRTIPAERTPIINSTNHA